MKLEFLDMPPTRNVIKVISVGGGGNNAIKHMLQQHIEGVEFICVDFETYALKKSSAQAILIGANMARGLDGGSPERSKQAALEERERIRSSLEGTDIVFIIAGIGGDTGAGASPVVAQIAKASVVCVLRTVNPYTLYNKWCVGRTLHDLEKKRVMMIGGLIKNIVILMLLM